MVDIADFAKVNDLLAQRRMIESGLGALEADATQIESFIVSGPNTNPPNARFVIDARTMAPPPPMFEAIKTLMQQRLNAINSELETLGVTGVEAATRTPPAAPAARRRSK